MRVYRLCKRAYADPALDGEGARLWGGRWNPPGRPLVYTSGSLPLAVLELLVNAEAAQLPSDLVTVTIEIPDVVSMATIEAGALPRGWRDHPAPAAVQAIGAEWLDSGRSAVLRVPSAVLPTDFNLLVNPRRPDASHVVVAARGPFAWDPRLERRTRSR